jgi:uncharacterized membrane protein
MATMGKQNLWLMNIFNPIEYFFLVWLFSYWQKSARVKLVMRISIGMYFVVWLGEILILDNLTGFSKFAEPLAGIIFVIAACMTLYEGNKNENVLFIDEPRFWISAGVLTYFSAVLTLAVTSNTLLNMSAESLKIAWTIQNIANVLSTILFLESFHCRYRVLKSGGY